MSEAERQHGDPEIGTCPVCGRVFAGPEELTKHLLDDHEGEVGTERSD